MKNSKTAGISLVALVVTIIVLIILTGAVIVTFMDGGIIDRANEAVFKNDMRSYQEQLAIIRANEQIAISVKDDDYDGPKVIGELIEKEKIKQVLPEFKDEYINLVKIDDGKLVAITNEEPYRTWLDDLGFTGSESSTTVIVGQVENVNLFNKATAERGYYIGYNETIYEKTDNYITTDFINVNPGDDIYIDSYMDEFLGFSYGITNNYHVVMVNYKTVSCYNENKEYIATYLNTVDFATNNERFFTVPEGVNYIRCSFFNGYGLLDKVFICKNSLPKYYAEYMEEEADLECKTYLPNEINVAINTEVNIYNENIYRVQGNEVDYDNAYGITVEWSGDIGEEILDSSNKSIGIKFLLDESDIGKHSLTATLYNENKQIIGTEQTTINVVSDTITASKRVLTIGDSLSTQSKWQSTVVSLSNSMLTLDNVAAGGSTANQFLSKTTIGSSNAIENPFYDSSIEGFSFEHYMQDKEEYDSVVVFLGTNNSGFNKTYCPPDGPTATNIRLTEIVDKIHEYNPDIKIYVVSTLNSNEVNSVGENARSKIAFHFMKNYIDTFSSYNNVTVIPMELFVNKTIDFSGEWVHPISSGNTKMANAIYSYICAEQ